MSGFSHYATSATHGAVQPDNTTTFIDDAGILHAGSGGATAVGASIVSDTGTKSLQLWNGSSNNTPPTLWQAISFDDSAWVASLVVTATGAPASPTANGGSAIWPYNGALSTSDQALFRRSFTLSSEPLVSATLQLGPNPFLGVWINGSLVAGSVRDGGAITITLPTTFLRAGTNVIAAWVYNDGMASIGHADWTAFSLTVNQTAPLGSSAGAALLLDYTETADVLSATTLSSDFWHDVGANHSFTKVHAASLIEIVLSCRLLAQAVGAGLVVVSQFVIDSAGTAILKDLGGDSVSNAEATMPVDGGSVWVSGLASGAHTVKLQLYPWTGSGVVVNLLCATDPVLYAFHLQVIEHA